MCCKDKTVFMFMGNGSPENRGCDAITRGTLNILNTVVSDASFINSFFLHDNNIDIPKYEIPVDNSPVHYPKRWTIKWFVLQFATFFMQKKIASLLYSKHKDNISKASVILSLGGDNYSLDYGVPRRFISLGKYVKKQKIPFVIWGASIGPFNKNSAFEYEIIKHLKEDVDLIFLREQESLDYLKNLGVSDNVHLSADPAFMMLPQACEFELDFILPRQYLTLNLSDLMAKYVTGGDMKEWIKLSKEIVEMLRTFNIPIILIPHVSSDFVFMNLVLNELNDSNEIYMASNNLNAAQYKWIISGAVCNIAARTHATIASFSTSVPTISLGYSVKSKGLNIQMYGNEDFLLYKESINVIALRQIVIRCLNERTKIVDNLKQKNLEIRQLLIKSGELLAEYIEKKK